MTMKYKRKIQAIVAASMAIAITCYSCACDKEPEDKTIEFEKPYDYTTGIDYTASAKNFITDGKTDYVIVIPQGAGTDIIESSRELSSYARDVSGANLVVYTESEGTKSVSEKFISVGKTALAEENGIKTDDIKYDGFVIKTVGDNVFISAELERGARYGVYSFLERFFGVRWLTATSTHVPKTSTISLYPCDITEEPEFMMRKWHSYAVDQRYSPAYYNHSRTYYGEWYNPGREYHNATDYAAYPGIGYLNKSDIADCDCDTHEKGIPLSEAHPEYWTDATNPSTQGYYDICFSNGVAEDGTLKDGPSGTRRIIDKIKGVLSGKDGDSYNWFHIGLMDYRGLVCKCETCLSRYAKYGGYPGGPGFSAVMVMFINCVEHEVNTWLKETQNGRTVNFSAFAYHDSEEPPVTVNADGTYEPISDLCVANENVYMRVPPIDADYAFAISDERQPQYEYYKKMFGGWSVCAKHLLVWDYVMNYFDSLMYYPSLSYYRENLRLYRDSGAEYIFSECSSSRREIWHADLRMYIANRLYWNLDWDIDLLLNEYLTLYYGAAADAVKEIIDIYENFYSEMKAEGTLSIKVSMAQTSYNKVETYPLEFLEKQFSVIEDATEKIKADGSLTDGEKESAIKLLSHVKLSPMAIVMKNYGSFYPLETQAEFVKEYNQLRKECYID